MPRLNTPSRTPAGFWQQTWMLLQKNWRTKRRQETKALLGEIVIPIIYLSILSLLVKTYKVRTFPSQLESFDTPTSVLNNPGLLQNPNAKRRRVDAVPLPLLIHVVPDDEDAKNFTDIMKRLWWEQVSIDRQIAFEFYPTVKDLEDFYANNTKLVNVALVLPSNWSKGQEFEYAIRVNPELGVPGPVQRMADLSTCRQKVSKELPLEEPTSCPVNNYFYWDFLAVQSLADQTVMKLSLPEVNVRLDVSMENVPKREYQEGMPTTLRVLVPWYSVFPLLQLINNILVLIVTEKTTKVKDGLKMVGVSDGAYWLSWLGVYGIIVALFSVAFTSIFTIFGVIKSTDPFILLLLFFLFGISVLCLAFVLTAFFHKPKTAGIVGSLFLQVASLLFLVQTFVEGSERSLLPLKLICSLAFTTGIDAAGNHEYDGGISWSDLRFGGKGEGMLTSLLFLLFDIFFYMFLTFYLDNVLPNEFGVRKHPLFLFQPSYWKGTSTSKDFGSPKRRYVGSVNEENVDDQNYEEVSPIMLGKEAIQIRGVHKTYTSFFSRDAVEAVKGISMDIYEGQITAILGRNGAGKSTLFNILTGLVAPTSGIATVFGLNSGRPYDMAKLRKILGVCLQQDLHFPSLTVEEHLEFYGKLRGMKPEELNSEINSILYDLKLLECRNTPGEKLSGGQKRKLSVGVALIGDPKVIMLDEPSAGLDPVSRRNLWTLLQSKKEGKVILLTTHFMDEADILADRKAIVHDGLLRCIGSSLFLKNKFGVGYYVTVVLNQAENDASSCDSIIEKWIPQALETRKVISHEVKYALPHSESSKFPSVFADLEAEIASGGAVQSFGVSMTTLEDVFLKISNGLDLERKGPNFHAENEEVDLIKETGRLEPSWGTSLWALCQLRIRRLVRSPQALFFMVVMPLVFTAGGFAVANIKPKTESSLTFGNPADIYPPEQLRVAVQETGDDFQRFLNAINIPALPYSGVFGDLVNVDSRGVMAAVDLYEKSFNESNLHVRARMRINGTFLHSPVIVLQLLNQYLASKHNDSPAIVVKHEPLRPLGTSDFKQLQASLFSVFLLGSAFTFSCTGLVAEIVHDREIKARNHLRVNGVTFGLYFTSMLLTYGVISLIVVFGQLITIAAFQVEAFFNVYAMTILAGMMVLYQIPSHLFNAIFSYAFDRMETAQTVYSQIASWAGSIVAFVVLIIDLAGVSPTIVRTVHLVMCSVNVFYIPYGIMYWMIKVYIQIKIYSFMGVDKEVNFSTYSTPEIYGALVCMLVQIPVFFLLLITADVLKNGGKPMHALRTLMKLHSPSIVQFENPDDHTQDEDEDVAAERSRIVRYFSGIEPNNDCVVAVKNLRKRYRKKKKINNVLNGVSLMVEKGEVFGLLGHNGAGKTTTIRVITAEESPDAGKVCLCGFDIKSNVSQAFSQLGFCPQTDALWDSITLREHLELYSKIRGVSNDHIHQLVYHFLRGLSIEEHADKYSEALSGGTKRKLSYAMAMLGAPKIVLLDEPSTGMDPQSKRFLWNTILGTFKESRGAVLTTHSMEEADILCSRIGIMVKGSIICVGSSQHLKDKFGAGYTIEIKLKSDVWISNQRSRITRTNMMMELSSRPSSGNSANTNASPNPEDQLPPEFQFLVTQFPKCRLLEAFGNRAVFFIAKDDVESVSHTFAVLEELKAEHEVQEYSFSQTTLEQVFLTFAKENEENEET